MRTTCSTCAHFIPVHVAYIPECTSVPGYCRKRHAAAAPSDQTCDQLELKPELKLLPHAEAISREVPSLALLSNLSDGVLMDKVAHGESAAFDEIDHRYHPLLVNYLRRRLHDDHAAEDVAQDVMVRLFNSSTHFDVTRSLRPWLFAIAGNELNRFWRDSGNLRNTLPLIAPPSRDGQSLDLTEMLRDQGLTPDEQLNLDSLVWLLRTQMARLPQEQRTALVMRMHGMKIHEIASKLDQPTGTISSRLRYGTLRIKAGLLHGHLSDEARAALLSAGAKKRAGQRPAPKQETGQPLNEH